MKLLRGNKIQSLDSQVNKKEPSLIPKLPFSLYISAGKGSGKTVSLINLLINKDMLANKFHQIYFFSPTSKLDEKTNILKETDIVLINKPLINLLKKDKKNSKIFDTEITEIETSTKIPEENFIESVDTKLLEQLIKEQKTIITKFGKGVADNILLIFDDCIGSKKFFSSETVQKMLFNSRHFKISIIITSQNYKSLPKPLRLNMSMILLFFTANRSELDSIYEENSSHLGFKTFEKIYNQITNIDFNFLTINYQNGVKYRLQNAFENFV